jgi:hypothetical protein
MSNVEINGKLNDVNIRFIKVKKQSKQPLEQDWAKTKNYTYNSPEILNWIETGGNYGITSPSGFAVFIDADIKPLQERLDASLPPTFRWSTGKPGHYEYAYLIEDMPLGCFPLRGGAYVKGKGGMVVGPGSIHPNGVVYGEREIRDVPIATVTEKQLMDALSDFLINKKSGNPEETLIHPKGAGSENIDREKIIQILTPYWDAADENRNDLTLDIAGFIRRAGGTVEDAITIIAGLVKNTGKGSDHIQGAKYAFNREGGEDSKIKGFTSLKTKMAELISKTPEELEQDINALTGAIPVKKEYATPEGNVEFDITETKKIGYDERNRDFYTLDNTDNGIRRNHIISIPIKWMGMAIDDNGEYFYHATIDGKTDYYTFDGVKDALNRHGITGSHKERVLEFLTYYAMDKNKINNAEHIHPDIIYLDKEGIIRLDNPYKFPVSDILKQLYGFYLISSSPDNFLINTAYMAIAPLSYHIRKNNLMFPYLINSGFAGAGKTTNLMLLANTGYAHPELHFTRNDLKTFYTLMQAVSKTTSPMTLEDVDMDWFRNLSPMLKGSADTVNAGSRGNINKVDKYESKSQICIDTNDSIDREIAQMDRYIVCNYTAEARAKINIGQFEKLRSETPMGFMYSVFEAIFSGVKLKDVIKDIYTVSNRQEVKINILKYVIDKINALMPPDSKFDMPDLSITGNEANATDWAAELYNIVYFAYEKMQSDEKSAPYGLQRGIVKVEGKDVYLTPTAYNMIRRATEMPYKTMKEFYNNTDTKDYIVKITSVRFETATHPVLCIKITPTEALLEQESKDKQKPTGQAPPIETPKQEPESEHASMIMDYRYNNKDSETLYYRLNKDFNKFDGAFFYGGHIIVDSVRKIMAPGTSEIAYILYKLIIPKHATDSDYPKGWIKFTTSSMPLDEKAYNALSKGDQK